MISLILENWQTIAGSIGVVVAFFGGKKLKTAEESKATSEALNSMQTTYDTFVNDLRERYNELKAEIKESKEEIKALKEANKTNHSQIVDLQNENKQLNKDIKSWELKYSTLQKEFDSYKKNN